MHILCYSMVKWYNIIIHQLFGRIFNEGNDVRYFQLACFRLHESCALQMIYFRHFRQDDLVCLTGLWHMQCIAFCMDTVIHFNESAFDYCSKQNGEHQSLPMLRLNLYLVASLILLSALSGFNRSFLRSLQVASHIPSSARPWWNLALSNTSFVKSKMMMLTPLLLLLTSPVERGILWVLLETVTLPWIVKTRSLQ